MSVSIRAVRIGDAREISEIYEPYVTSSSISFEEVAPSSAEMRGRIEKVTQNFPWLVAVDANSRILGYAYAGQHRERPAYKWSVDVTVYIREGQHGKGLGKALYSKLFELLRNQNYYRAFAGITLPNAASIGIHESLGFKPVGVYKNVGFKQGHWHDVGRWELTLQELRTPPLLPIAPWTHLR